MAPQPPQAKTPTSDIPAHLIREENNEAVIGAAEDVNPDPGHTEPLDQNPQIADPENGLTRKEPIPRSPHDDARSAIAKRFRRAEPEEERPFNNDFNDPENLYGEFGREEERLSDEEYDRRAAEAERSGQQPQPKKPDAAQPRMITRKVRGKDVTKSEDEWLDDAARVSAADSYLEEAKQLLADAREIRRSRATPGSQHPESESATEDTDLLDPPTSDQHPDPTFKDVIQKIQYGDPEEAAADLERIVKAEAKKESTQGALQRTFDQDLARSKKQLKAFADANPDLAADEISAMAIERGMYQLYREEIEKLGIDAAQIPKTPVELANWHRFYRVHGYEVSSTTDLLNESAKRFRKWKGAIAAPAKPAPSRQAPPRVAVNVNRDERRMAIPVQPTRTVAPKRDAAPPPRGTDVVNSMRRARGQPVI